MADTPRTPRLIRRVRTLLRPERQPPIPQITVKDDFSQDSPVNSPTHVSTSTAVIRRMWFETLRGRPSPEQKAYAMSCLLPGSEIDQMRALTEGLASGDSDCLEILYIIWRNYMTSNYVGAYPAVDISRPPTQHEKKFEEEPPVELSAMPRHSTLYGDTEHIARWMEALAEKQDEV